MLGIDPLPLMARVVSIFEKSLGENHPNVATALNNLAQLLQAAHRLWETRRLSYAAGHAFGVVCYGIVTAWPQSTACRVPHYWTAAPPHFSTGVYRRR